MENTARVSIVIPCYNQAQYLPEAIESCLAQNYPEVQIIVVNDGSPDNTSEVAKRYPVILVEKPNGGLASARNAGIIAATGQYILPLDADDKISPNCVEQLLNSAGPDMIVCPELEEFGEGHNRHSTLGPLTKEMLLQANQIHCCSLFPKAKWEQVGGYDESVIMRQGYEDWDFWVRLFAVGCKVISVPGPHFYYRIRSNSMVHQISPSVHLALHAYIQSKHQ